jgi:hypothetical protein
MADNFITPLRPEFQPEPLPQPQPLQPPQPLPEPFVPLPQEVREPASPITRVTVGERDKLLSAGLDPETVNTLIRDRAAAEAQRQGQEQETAVREQQRVLEEEWEIIPEEELDQMRNAEEYGPEWEEVDDLEVFTDEQLTEDDNFSLEAYVSRNPEALQDNAKVDRLANIFKERAKEPITVGDVAIGAAKLPWTGIKMVAKFTGGVGQTLYDVFSPIGATALGEVTGQGPEFFEALEQQTQKAQAEDLAGLEKGTLGFAQWMSRATTHLPRRWGFSSWDDVPPEKLREEFRNAMADFLQTEAVGRGEGEFSRAIGGEILKEIEERGETLDPERVARVAEADPIGFFMFGRVFQGAGLLGKKGVQKALQGKTTLAGKELATLRSEVAKHTRNLPANSPTRAFSEQLLQQAERDAGAFSKSVAAIQRTINAADDLGRTEARLGAATRAAEKFATPEAKAAVRAAQESVNEAQIAIRGNIGAQAVNRIQTGLSKIPTGAAVGEKVTAAGLRTTGQAARGIAKVIETLPVTAGVGALATGNIGTGVALLVGARALGLQKIAASAARPFRAIERGAGGAGRAISRGLPETNLQKAIQGIAQGSGDIAVGALKGMPIDVGFALALAESPESVQNMSGYATAFGGLHQVGRPFARYTQALLTGRQAGRPPAFVAPRGGVLKNAQDASQAGRRFLAPEQTQRIASTEQFLNEMGSDTPVYVMPDRATYRNILEQQFTAKQGRAPNTREAAVLDNASQQRGMFLEEIVGDNGQRGSAIFVTDVEAVPHEGQHAFQQVLGRSGNDFVDQVIFDHYADRWEQLGAEYAVNATGDPNAGSNWRNVLNRFAPESLKEAAGRDPARTADVFLAREIGAENFSTLFEAIG